MELLPQRSKIASITSSERQKEAALAKTRYEEIKRQKLGLKLQSAKRKLEPVDIVVDKNR